MPHVRNFYYRTIKCHMCQKIIKTNDEKWFCSKECEDEWKLLNGECNIDGNARVKGGDTSG